MGKAGGCVCHSLSFPATPAYEVGRGNRGRMGASAPHAITPLSTTTRPFLVPFSQAPPPSDGLPSAASRLQPLAAPIAVVVVAIAEWLGPGRVGTTTPPTSSGSGSGGLTSSGLIDYVDALSRRVGDLLQVRARMVLAWSLLARGLCFATCGVCREQC